MNIINKILDRPQFIQRTNDWYRKRYDLLTASSIASILNANPYKSRIQLLEEKSLPYEKNEFTKNPALIWGIKYEPVANDIYQKIKNEKVYDVGLLIHEKYDWIGASPDGVLESGKLVEIKCIYHRNLTNTVPLYYWMQMQLQLEVCDLEECDLFQCKFEEYKTKKEYLEDKISIHKGEIKYEGKKYYWKLVEYTLNVIKRDRSWFNDNLPIFYNFWKDILYCRENGFDKMVTDNYNDIKLNKRKRQLLPVEKKNLINNSGNNSNLKKDGINLRIKRQKLRYVGENWQKWNFTGDVKNFVSNDPILDWFNLYNPYHQKYDKTDKFNNYISQQEINFKKNVIQQLQQNFPNDTITIAHQNEKFSIEKHHKTIYAMMNGIPIIIKGLLHDKERLLCGMPDLLIRTDFLLHIIGNLGTNEEILNTKLKYDYRVVNIKNNTISLNKNGYILNKGNINGYKAECILNNELLETVLEIKPKTCYMIGKKYSQEKIEYDIFEMIGQINSSEYDKNLLIKANNGLEWLKNLKEEGENWDITNPHRWELCPNMSNYFDYPYHNIKKELAEKNKEITLLWNCGVKEREIANKVGIKKWNNINTDMINFVGSRKEILDNIIKINKSNEKSKIIMNECDNKKLFCNKIEFYIDFETTGNINNVTIGDMEDMIYMVGIGYEIDGEWIFKSFVADRLTLRSEKKIMKNWISYMKDIKNKYKVRGNIPIYHWSKAEIIMSNKAFRRHNIKEELYWIDLLDVFKDNRIAIKGVFNYGLKNVANGLYKHKLIKSKWDDNSLDGTSAILAAWESENRCKNGDEKKLLDCKEIEVIIKYNEMDCKVLWDILKMLKDKFWN